MAVIIPPVRLRAFEYRGRLEGGRSRLIWSRALTPTGKEHSVVLKLREIQNAGCTFGAASLACELVCSMLARAAGLSVPDYAIVEVPDDFERIVQDRVAQDEIRRNSGENFGSSYHEDHARYLRGMGPGPVGRVQIESILAFDAYALNNDRKATNPNLLVRGETILLIDHSLAFAHLGSPDVAEPWKEWLPDDQIREHCTFQDLRGTGPTFELFVDFLANSLTDENCREMLDFIPDSWQRTGHDDKDSVLRYLLRRSQPYLKTEPGRLAQVCRS